MPKRPSYEDSPYERAEALGEDNWWFDAGEDRVGFWTRVPGHPGWVVQVSFQNASKRPEVHAIKITPFGSWAPADDPMTTALWRSVRPGELLKRAWARVQTKEVIELLGRGLPPERQQSKSRPPRKRASDALYEHAVWAARYVALIGTPDPIQQLHRQHNLSASRIRNILWSARQEGLLTKAVPGTATGVLTPKAERMLQRGTH